MAPLALPRPVSRMLAMAGVFAQAVSGMSRTWLPLILAGFVIALSGCRKAETAGTVLERDREFDGSSKITLSALSPVQAENLAALCKVWGFIKYHHPKVTAGERHWDYELFRIMPAILAVADRAAADAALLRWVEALGAVAPAGQTADPTDVHFHADNAWIDDTTALTPELSTWLRAVHAARSRDQQQFYVSMAANVENPVFDRELTYPKIDTPDAGYRLLALFRFWNVIQYWFPYRNLLDENWHAVLREFIPRFAHAATADAYQLELLALIARVDDTHANLRTATPVRPPVGEALIPAVFRFVGQQAVVSQVVPLAGQPPGPLQPGDVVTAIDGTPVSNLIEAWSPYYPASNQPTRLRNITYGLRRGPAGPVKLRIERGAETLDVEGQRIRDGGWTRSIRFSHELPGPAFRRLSDQVAYLALLGAKASDVPRYVEQAAGTKGWILDLRNYPADFPVLFALGARLVDKPTVFAQFTAGSPANPGTFSFLRSKALLSPAAPQYNGKIVILVDEVTQSRAEYFAMAFRATPGAVVIGSTTAGADGNYSEVPLPGCAGKLRTGISGIGIFYPDKRPTQRIGIVPDIVAQPTVAGIRAGRDEVLEAALRHLLGPGLGDDEILKLTIVGQ